MKANVLEYPLGEKVAERIKGRTGRPLSQLTVEALRRGDLCPEDLMIDAETLKRQAEIAEVAGYRQVSNNLRRAAELTALSNEELLSLYNALRPYRSSYEELVALADELRIKYRAEQTARLVGEAARVYLAHGLCRA